jgi:excisionase family DNA binding protein
MLKQNSPTIRTVPETAELLQLSRAQIFMLLKTGQLSSYKIGRSRRIGQNHIDAYLSTVETGSSAA